jgi:outer membrane protein OmpA-like peptidoglycan-associated protein
MLRFATVLCAGLLAGPSMAQTLMVETIDGPVVVQKLTLAADEHFAFGSATLGTSAIDEMSPMLEAIARVKTPRLLVSGHADRLGDKAYNLELSLKRAEAVAAYLRSEVGLPAGAIGVAAVGEARPLVACETETGDALKACLAPNRRVEVAFVGHALVDHDRIVLLREVDSGGADLIEIDQIDRTTVRIVE